MKLSIDQGSKSVEDDHFEQVLSVWVTVEGFNVQLRSISEQDCAHSGHVQGHDEGGRVHRDRSCPLAVLRILADHSFAPVVRCVSCDRRLEVC